MLNGWGEWRGVVICPLLLGQLVNFLLRASNKGLLRPRVARARGLSELPHLLFQHPL